MKEHYSNYCPMKQKGQCNHCGEIMLRSEISNHIQTFHQKKQTCKCHQNCENNVSLSKCLNNQLTKQKTDFDNQIKEVQIQLQQVD